jgi:predicted metal-binding transcription factor (methanogenesis marker protein 9)
MATVLKNFERWKQFLSERVEQARKAGMSDETISTLASQLGEFLADKVDPENKEERVLKELWDVADESERKVIARLMVKLVSNE